MTSSRNTAEARTIAGLPINARTKVILSILQESDTAIEERDRVTVLNESLRCENDMLHAQLDDAIRASHAGRQSVV